MITILKIILSISLLLYLFHFPYGYYQFVRIAALVGFSILAYNAYKRKANLEMIMYIGLAILFQPIIKIALGRTLWNIVDIIVAIGLFISLMNSKKLKPWKSFFAYFYSYSPRPGLPIKVIKFLSAPVVPAMPIMIIFARD